MAISRQAFGPKERLAQAIADGKLQPYDVVYMDDGGVGVIGWINEDGQYVSAASAGAAAVTVKTTNEWLNQPEYLPQKGELIVYSDYQKVIEGGITKNIPSMKVGDGINTIRQLSFLNGGQCQLSHKLTIGTYVFDGTQDITIPVYDGSNE